MLTIGLLGGMSWESTVDYYRAINQGINRHLGGLHSARIILYSVDFDSIEKMQHAGDWEAATIILCRAANKLQSVGADFILICTNTMHKVADEVQKTIKVPLLHIADATAEVILEKKLKSIGLLGTKFTMEHDFYRGRLQQRYGINVIVPDKDDREIVHRIIYDELCKGLIVERSKGEFLRIIQRMSRKGVEGIILGCTEIGMLLKQSDTDMIIFDTTKIHAAKAVEFAVGKSKIS